MKYDKAWLNLMEKEDSALTDLIAPMYDALENARKVCRNGDVRRALINATNRELGQADCEIYDKVSDRLEREIDRMFEALIEILRDSKKLQEA